MKKFVLTGGCLTASAMLAASGYAQTAAVETDTVLRSNEDAGLGDGLVSGRISGNSSGFYRLDLSNAGDLIFAAKFVGTDDTSGNDRNRGFVYRDGSLLPVFIGGETAAGVPGATYQLQTFDIFGLNRDAPAFWPKLTEQGTAFANVDLLTADGDGPEAREGQDNDQALYYWDGTSATSSALTVLEREFEFPPIGNGEFSGFIPLQAADGDISLVFAGTRGDTVGSGLYVATPTTFEILLYELRAPFNAGGYTFNTNLNENFNTFLLPDGRLLVLAERPDGRSAFYVGDAVGNGPFTEVLVTGAEGDPIFPFEANSLYDANANGQFAFRATDGTTNAIYVFDGTQATQAFATSGFLSAGGTSVGAFPRLVQIDEDGDVFIFGSSAIQRFSNGALEDIVSSTSINPVSGSPIGSIGGRFQFIVGGHGHVIFDAGNTSRYITDGIDLINLEPVGESYEVRPGELVNYERLFTTPDFAFGSLNIAGNDHGQAAIPSRFNTDTFNADFALLLHTPKLYFRATAGDGLWDNPLNWTLTIDPAHPHDVYVVNDQQSIEVQGPGESTAVESLTIGGANPARLDVRPGTNIAVSDDLTLEPNATLGFSTASPAGGITVGGDTTLGGVLDLACIAGDAGEQVVLIDTDGTVGGSFETVVGGSATVENGQVIATLSGLPDLTGDGEISTADLDVYKTAFNAEDPTAQLALPFDTFDTFDYIRLAEIFAGLCNN